MDVGPCLVEEHVPDEQGADEDTEEAVEALPDRVLRQRLQLERSFPRGRAPVPAAGRAAAAGRLQPRTMPPVSCLPSHQPPVLARPAGGPESPGGFDASPASIPPFPTQGPFDTPVGAMQPGNMAPQPVHPESFLLVTLGLMSL